MSERLQILVPEGLHRRLQQAAERRHITKSEWARWAFEVALRSDAGGDDPLARLTALDAPTADIDEMNAEILAGRGA